MRRYTAIKWILKKTQQSCSGHGPKLFRLQLHQNPSYTSHESGNGRWRYRSAVEGRGLGCPLGSLRVSEGGKSGVNDPALTFDVWNRSARSFGTDRGGRHRDSHL
jgi:hypothetical protein